MFISNKGKIDFKNLSKAALAIAVVGLLTACENGDTDGGEAVDVSDNTFPEFVSNGGSLRIDPTVSRLNLGDKGGFFVRVRDADGAPLDGIRITCSAENGIALFSGVNEITNDNGEVSGNFCGVAGGSFILECRAPVGFGLIDRETIVVSHDGDIAGCDKFSSGTATGTVNALSADLSFGNDIRIDGISYKDAGGNTTSGPLDIEAGVCTDGTDEPFSPIQFSISLDNDTGEAFTTSSVSFTFSGSGGVISTGPLAVATVDGDTVTGVLQNVEGLTTTGPGVYAVTLDVDIEAADGSVARITAQSSVTFGPADNC